MELEELIERMETLAAAISGEKGKILAYIFKHGERTYDQLALFIDEAELKNDLEDLEGCGLVKPRKELLHPFRSEEVYSLSEKGLYYLMVLESMFEREDTFFEAFVLKLAEVVV